MSRILHTMLRVSDLQCSIDFYTKILGMRVLRKFEHDEQDYSLVFIGYGDESATCVLELTYNHGVSSYEMGTAFGHIAIAVDNCELACAEIQRKGGTIVMAPKTIKGMEEKIAFLTDPDGYKIELIERH